MLENLKQRLLNEWSLMRFIRLGLAGVIFTEAWMNYDILFAILGGALLFQAAFNYGCCGTSGCNVSTTTNSKTLNNNQETVTYTEIK